MVRIEEGIGVPFSFLPSSVLSDIWPVSQEDLPICGSQPSSAVATYMRQSTF